MTKITDIAPIYETPHGKLWALDYVSPPVGSSLNVTQLRGWVVHAPWAHPLWEYYFVSLIHLRSVAGVQDATKYAPDATHEIGVFAVDPNKIPESGETPNYLSPPNFIGQFGRSSDEIAIEYALSCLHEVCDGALSPDTDFRREWESRFPYLAPRVVPMTGSVH